MFGIHPSTQKLIDDIRAINKKIRIGASCVHLPDRFDEYCKTVEIRTCEGLEQSNPDHTELMVWKSLQKALYCKCYIRFNIADYYSQPKSEAHYRGKFRYYLTKLYNNPQISNNNCIIDCQNEPMKRRTPEQYINYLNLLVEVNKQVAKELGKDRFLVGGGCEEFALAATKKEYKGTIYAGGFYEILERFGKHDVTVIHIQSSCNAMDKLRFWENWFNTMILGQSWYREKPITCNEANWQDVGTLEGFNHLLEQLLLALRWNCLDFNIVFIRLSGHGTNNWLTFIADGHNRTVIPIGSNLYQDNYQILTALAAELEPEEEDMRLEEFYYRNKVTYNRDPKKAGIKFIQTVLGIKVDGIWGPVTDKAVADYQETMGLDVDRIVGPLTFREMMKTHPNAYIDLQYFTATGEW